MPCGCLGHLDQAGECEYPALVTLARRLVRVLVQVKVDYINGRATLPMETHAALELVLLLWAKTREGSTEKLNNERRSDDDAT